MAGIAIVIKDISFAGNNLGQVVFEGQTIPITGIAISESQTVPLNTSSLSLTAVFTPQNTTQKSIVWSVTNGGTYASINQNGLVTLRNLVANAQFTVKVESTADASVNATKTFTVVSGNMLVPKVGYKPDTNGELVADSDYICSEWIDVQNVSLVELTLPTTVAIENQGQNNNYTYSNMRIGIVYEDFQGNYITLYIANNFISTEFTSDTMPLKISTLLMRKCCVFALVENALGSNINNLIRYKASDWSNGGLSVVQMTDSIETYDESIMLEHAVGPVAATTILCSGTTASIYARNSNPGFRGFCFSLRNGDSLTMKTKGASNNLAYLIFSASDLSKISQSEASADFTQTAFSYTATQDVYIAGTCVQAAFEDFEVVITRS